MRDDGSYLVPQLLRTLTVHLNWPNRVDEKLTATISYRKEDIAIDLKGVRTKVQFLFRSA